MFDRIGGQPVLYSSHKLAGLAIQTAGHPGSRSGALGTCMDLTPASYDVHTCTPRVKHKPPRNYQQCAQDTYEWIDSVMWSGGLDCFVNGVWVGSVSTIRSETRNVVNCYFQGQQFKVRTERQKCNQPGVGSISESLLSLNSLPSCSIGNSSSTGSRFPKLRPDESCLLLALHNSPQTVTLRN